MKKSNIYCLIAAALIVILTIVPAFADNIAEMSTVESEAITESGIITVETSIVTLPDIETEVSDKIVINNEDITEISAENEYEAKVILNVDNNADESIPDTGSDFIKVSAVFASLIISLLALAIDLNYKRKINES